MHLYQNLASHLTADVTGAMTFVSVLCLRLYLLWRAASLHPWQLWLGTLIDGVGYLLYRIVEALLIALLVALLTKLGVVGEVVTCIQHICRV